MFCIDLGKAKSDHLYLKYMYLTYIYVNIRLNLYKVIYIQFIRDSIISQNSIYLLKNMRREHM